MLCEHDKSFIKYKHIIQCIIDNVNYYLLCLRIWSQTIPAPADSVRAQTCLDVLSRRTSLSGPSVASQGHFKMKEPLLRKTAALYGLKSTIILDELVPDDNTQAL